MNRRLIIVLSAVCLFANGCSKDTMELYDVSGTVKYEDGSIPKSEMASITFNPTQMKSGLKGASGTIEEDGSFQLTTVNRHDGAVAADYIVTLNIIEGYPRPKSLIAAKYSSSRATPLKATVEPNNKNHFDFVIEAK